MTIAFADIFAMMDQWETRLVGIGRHDNTKLKGLWLKLWADGSGSVMAEYAKSMPDETEEEALVNTVFMEPTSILEFETLRELHGGLVAQTMSVRRDDTEADDDA